MPALIAASAVRTCLGTGEETFAGLLRGECGAGPLRFGDPGALNVAAGYHVPDGDPARPFRAGRLLAGCVADAARRAALDTSRQRVIVVVGTGLGELSAIEDRALNGTAVALSDLHFGAAVRAVLPGAAGVTTVSNACAAGGHALALAQDLVELGEADAVVAAATDTMTRSMLTMIGKVGDPPADRVRPFDRNRRGVLLGDGAAAAVVVPEGAPGPVLARLAGTGLSCDARHQTAPDVAGIGRAMRDAFERTGHEPSDVDLVVAHGTGTALNDPAECEALRASFADGRSGTGADGVPGEGPLVTAVKGAVGHTSGSAALVNLDVAVRCLTEGVVPPVVGLRSVLDEGEGLRFVTGSPVRRRPRLVQSDAFGFGGVNAVTLLEAP
ncbi:beta-ketoacyl synthase [Actinomadura sp. CNU-125]|uniref:beta-ketoacyl synthase N-terminal-like domain-containing protein n=1 Tax=Actinomadura sp. CNU-125 TaxID=1904961 RepID=UPI00095C381E|nr:beta-ketoacyl synthase N-terminal-like domain-containing protein [Actinomadura sp. CNU-125]OLT19105.1 beta-ketoacyl synthase [Actinomadura sp. CNU-125]